jgi:hypothetical protein
MEVSFEIDTPLLYTHPTSSFPLQYSATKTYDLVSTSTAAHSEPVCPHRAISSRPIGHFTTPSGMKVSTEGEGLQAPSTIQSSVEPIAIVGFGFKFPQDITSAETLWKLLMERRSTMTEIPKNRWNIDGFYKEHGHRPGTVRPCPCFLIYRAPSVYDLKLASART